MKLFFSPGTCALAVHIVLAEINEPFELEKVSFKNKTYTNGSDFLKINSLGYVPVLELNNKEFLMEASAILQYLADSNPETKLIPDFGTLDRYRCLENLNFIATELHKGYSPLFHPEKFVSKEETNLFKENVKTILKKKLDFVSRKMGLNEFLCGKRFLICDAYLFTILSWSEHVGIDLKEWKNLSSYVENLKARPSVMQALKEEGLS